MGLHANNHAVCTTQHKARLAMVEKSRVVVIQHPDFNDGTDGIQEAKTFAESLVGDMKNMLTKLPPDMPQEDRQQFADHISKFKVLIRKVPDNYL